MIHCTTCASIGRCEDAVRNGYVIKCIHFGELSRQASFIQNQEITSQVTTNINKNTESEDVNERQD